MFRPLTDLGKLALALLMTAAILASSATGAFARAEDSSAAGVVLSSDGIAITGAAVTLSGNGPAISAVSDRHGAFAFAHLLSGTYSLVVTAPGYNPIGSQTVQIAPNAKTTIDLRLPRAQASSLTVIGTARTNGAQTISTLPAPTLDISMQPYAQHGETRVSDILGDQLSTTVIPVIGGGLNAPAVVSLRGPDPSETLVDIDGHQVNNGSTGDFDLSLLDPADLTSAQVLYGIAPSSLFGPNTLGGALNVRTLEPTAQAHALERFTGGSFGTFGETLQATGTSNRLGYAFSYHRLTSAGDQHNTPFPAGDGGTAPIGDSLDATSIIGKLRYSLWNGAGFIGISLRDQAVFRDISSTLSSVEPGAGPNGTDLYSNFSGTSILSHNAAYDFDLQAPLGPRDAGGYYSTSVLFRHQTSIVDQTVNGPGAATSPYLYNDRDLIADDTLEIDHILPHGHLSLRYAQTNENLTTNFIPGIVFASSAVRMADDIASFTPGERQLRPLDDASTPDVSIQQLGQTQRSLGMRYAFEPNAHLHFTLAGYYSSFSTFGHSIDPRFGFVWTPNADSAFRMSAGSTFQSPQLPTLLVPPTLPAPVDGFINVGNPNATAERATSYDVGYDHRFVVNRLNIRLGGDVYRTNLHNGVATFIPLIQCAPGVTFGNNPPCLSFPVNVTQEVYQGLELHGNIAFSPSDVLRLGYDVDSVYTQGYPPTAADDVPLYEQSLGVPLHKFTLDFAHDTGRSVGYYVGLRYEGSYNETNLAPYASVQAGLAWHLPHFDINLSGKNLTDVYDFKQVRVGAGIPYGGLTDVVPTDAIPLAPRTFTFSLTHRM